MAALLFDLDETLVVEEPSAVAAFEATARHAAELHPLDAAALALGARARARELWWAAPTHAYCQRIGISSWEGLWCRYESDGEDMRQLRAWAPAYRREAWRLALLDQGVDDVALAEALGERFGAERRARHVVFDDARAALEELGLTHELALVTNGASCLQREKLRHSGLEHHFRVIVASGDVGAAKPHTAIFHHALAGLRTAGPATMVGDSLERDIAGALDAGLHAVWLNRTADTATAPPGVPTITSLAELAGVLG